MKYILELILSTIVIYFVWNILRRLFFTTFHNNERPSNPTFSEKKDNSKIDKKINWDAETVDFEEVKEDSKKSEN